MEENYLLAKKIVSKRFDEDNKFYPFFVLAIYGELTVFKNYKDFIEEIFDNVLIIISNKTINNTMLENNLDPEAFFNNDNSNEEIYKTEAISYCGYDCDFDGEKLKAVKTDPFIICTTFYNNSWEHLLAAFIHEFSHIIKGAINGCHISKDKNHSIFTTRCGLSIFKLIYDKNKNEFSQNVSYEILDEVINCAHTNDIINEILAIKDIIPDQKISNFLEILNKRYLKDTGYERASNSFKPLWRNNTFKTLINNNIVLGNINLIEEEFNKILGFNSLEKLNELLLKIDELDYSNLNHSKEMKKIKNIIIQMIQDFNQKTKVHIKS